MSRPVVMTVARREWQAALAARWFWYYGAATGLLGGGLLWIARGMLPAGIPPDVAGGRVLMATVNLLAFLVPLMGLTAGTQSLAGERDRRTLGYLLAQPVTRQGVLAGKLLGNGLALGAVLAAAGVVLAGVATALQIHLPTGALMLLIGLAWLLALSTMALGALLSAGPVGLVAAQGAMLAAWLLLVVLGDLSAMGLLMARKVPPQALLALTLLNPVHQFRVAAVALIRPTLEVLGPVGLYVESRLGGSLVPALLLSQICWAAAAALAAQERFRRSRIGF